MSEMSTFQHGNKRYVGRQWVTIRRQELVTVWADSTEDAFIKLTAGAGTVYAFLGSEVINNDEPFTDISEHDGGGW